MGEFFALLTAVFWGGAVIFFKRSGESIPPLALNFFRVAVSSVLLLLTMLIMGQPPWRAASGNDLLLIAASGVIAIALADTLFHASLNRVGAGITAVVDCLYPPLTTVFAFFLLGERLGPSDLAGMVLVISAVLLTTRATPLPGITRRQLLFGLLLGAAGMASLSLGIVLVKPVLASQPVIWVTAMRQFVALAVLTPLILFSSRRRAESLALFRNRSVLRFALPGTFMGSYFSLMCWIAGMKYIMAGTAAILNQTSMIYIILLARIFLKEPLSKRRLLAVLLAATGILFIVLD